MKNMIIELISGYREGTQIDVTDERHIGGIHWIGGKVLDKEEDGFSFELGGQWLEGRDYKIVEA